jgi:integrase
MNDKPKRQNKAHTVVAVLEMMKKLPADVADMVWTMATTGMGLTVYLERQYELKEDRILIHDTKMERVDERRDRFVPLIYPPVAPVVQLKAFRRWLKKASGATIRPYDLRSCYAMWMIEAGIAENRVEQYMGHQASTMTRKYARTDVDTFLKDDAKKAKSYLEGLKKVEVNPNAEQFFN